MNSTASSIGSSRSAITDVESVSAFEKGLAINVLKSEKAHKWASFKTNRRRKEFEAAKNSANLVSVENSNPLDAGPLLSRSSLGAGRFVSSGSLTEVSSRNAINAGSSSSSDLQGLSISVQNIVNINTSRSYSMPLTSIQRDPLDPDLLLNPLSQSHPNKVLLKPISQDRNARPNAAFKKRTPNKSSIKSPVKMIGQTNFQPQLLHKKRTSLSPLKLPGSGYKLLNPACEENQKKIPIYLNPIEKLEPKMGCGLEPGPKTSVPELIKTVNSMGQLQSLAASKPQVRIYSTTSGACQLLKVQSTPQYHAPLLGLAILRGY